VRKQHGGVEKLANGGVNHSAGRYSLAPNRLAHAAVRALNVRGAPMWVSGVRVDLFILRRRGSPLSFARPPSRSTMIFPRPIPARATAPSGIISVEEASLEPKIGPAQPPGRSREERRAPAPSAGPPSTGLPVSPDITNCPSPAFPGLLARPVDPHRGVPSKISVAANAKIESARISSTGGQRARKMRRIGVD